MQVNPSPRSVNRSFKKVEPDLLCGRATARPARAGCSACASEKPAHAAARQQSRSGSTLNPSADSKEQATARERFRFSVVRIPALILEGLVVLYQRLVSPLLHAIVPGAGCRFAPTCSEYARQALRRHGAWRGSWLALRRISRCHPWHPGGLDPVPPSPKKHGHE